MTLKEIRAKYNLSQAKLASLTGIPKRNIENWESGSRPIKSYMPGLIEAKLEQIMNNGGIEMAEFDLGLAVCRVRERAQGAYGFYFRYMTANNIDFNDENNIYVKNMNELGEIGRGLADECKTEADTTALFERIKELRKIVE